MMPNRFCHARSRRQAQAGVALFVALIAMVVLSLAGIALVRSVDTGAGIAGNVAFRQASMVAANRAVEDAVYKLFKSAAPIDPTADSIGNNYYASLQPLEVKDGTPNLLAGSYPPPYDLAGLPVWTDAATKFEVRHVIERVCTAAGPTTIGTCDMLPPKVSPAGTDNEVHRIPLPTIPHYRVTVRVDIPNTNTTSIAQTFLR
jgi:type IV pilus assembly protein PilX